MLYNKEQKTINTRENCLTCKYFNKKEKKCTGLGKCCFEFDPKTRVMIDTLTKKPIKIKEM